jgi:hypothetical protein
LLGHVNHPESAFPNLLEDFEFPDLRARTFGEGHGLSWPRFRRDPVEQRVVGVSQQGFHCRAKWGLAAASALEESSALGCRWLLQRREKELAFPAAGGFEVLVHIVPF